MMFPGQGCATQGRAPAFAVLAARRTVDVPRRKLLLGVCQHQGRRNCSDVPRGRALPPRVEHQHSAATPASHHDNWQSFATQRCSQRAYYRWSCTYTNRRCSGVKLGPTRFLILVTAQRSKSKRRGEEAVGLLPVRGSTSRDNGEYRNRSSDETRCQTG